MLPPARTQEARRIRLDSERSQRDEWIQANDGKRTRRGDFTSVVHDSIKEVLNCRPVISKVVRSGDGC